jgi:glycosyltransferase involved in cell wall biosynthesis
MRYGLQGVDISVVAPAHNEQNNLRPLVEQIIAALEPVDRTYEIIIVDDNSTDASPRILKNLLTEHLALRVIRLDHVEPGRGRGQSAAFDAGFRASRGQVIATLDADLQNDPADIPRMIELLNESGADVIQGDRSNARRDGMIRRASSRVGRFFRRLLLRDTIRDTGCSLRIMKREVALALPLGYRGMHRFVPITARQLGFRVIETPVNHRPRSSGVTNYGIWNRALPGLIDCLAVRWMRNRRTAIDFVEVLPPQPYARDQSGRQERRPETVRP